MSKDTYSIITGTGSYIPTKRVYNNDFLGNEFYDSDGKKFDKTNEEIINKFAEITGIKSCVLLPSSWLIYPSNCVWVAVIGYAISVESVNP